MLRGGSKKWVIVAHFALAHLYDDSSLQVQRRALSPNDYHEFMVMLDGFKSLVKWDRGNWCDAPLGMAAETILKGGPVNLIGELLVQFLPYCTAEQARKLAASCSLRALEQITLPLSRLNVQGHITFHAAFADEAQKICSTGSSVDFTSILNIYKKSLPIEIQDVIDPQIADQAYRAYVLGSDSSRLGLQVYNKKVREALVDPKRVAALASQQHVASAESARSLRQALSQRRGQHGTMVAQLEHFGDTDGGDATALVLQLQQEGRMDEAQVMIAAMHSGYPAVGSNDTYDRRTPDETCTACGRAHPGGRRYCFQIIDRTTGALLTDVQTDLGARMARAAPKLSSTICTHSTRPAWCFPGGPPASSCAMAAAIRAKAEQGDIKIYSANGRTSVTASLEQVNAYITEVTGKLTPCHDPQCPNKRPSPSSPPYPKGLRDCAVWASGAANLVTAVQTLRGGNNSAQWSSHDRQALITFIDMADQDLEDTFECGTWHNGAPMHPHPTAYEHASSQGQGTVCALTAAYQADMQHPAAPHTAPTLPGCVPMHTHGQAVENSGTQHPLGPSSSPFYQVGDGTGR